MPCNTTCCASVTRYQYQQQLIASTACLLTRCSFPDVVTQFAAIKQSEADLVQVGAQYMCTQVNGLLAHMQEMPIHLRALNH